MSQSLVNESAGARTPVSGLIAAALHPVRRAVCVGIAAQPAATGAGGHRARGGDGPGRVQRAAAHLALQSSGVPRRHRRHARRAWLGPVNGVLLGAAISIVLLLRQAARPRVIELARVPGTTYFADRLRHPENELIPGVLVVRCEAALLYFNVRVRPRAPARAVERAPGSGAADRLLPRRGSENRSRRRRAAGRPAHDTFARAAWSSGSPKRMARCVTRCDGLGSSGTTGRSRPVRPSTASSRSGRRTTSMVGQPPERSGDR